MLSRFIHNSFSLLALHKRKINELFKAMGSLLPWFSCTIQHKYGTKISFMQIKRRTLNLNSSFIFRGVILLNVCLCGAQQCDRRWIRIERTHYVHMHIFVAYTVQSNQLQLGSIVVRQCVQPPKSELDKLRHSKSSMKQLLLSIRAIIIYLSYRLIWILVSDFGTFFVCSFVPGLFTLIYPTTHWIRTSLIVRWFGHSTPAIIAVASAPFLTALRSAITTGLSA